MLHTPILLITFNRPEHTRRVLTEILKQEPQSLYVCQDGARDGNENDRIKCQEVRDVVNELTSAYKSSHEHFTLHTLYQSKNLGCGPGPAAGITWFFDNVEQGIIMEDDCLPSETLMAFEAELLEKYKNDERISLITGTNALSRWRSYKYDYIFSKTGGMTMGSWASWRRAWKHFDLELKSWGNQLTKDKMLKIIGEKAYSEIAPLYDKIYANPPRDAWDYQWAFARTLLDSYSIVSTVNQMSNIGFGEESTHTPNSNDRRGNMTIYKCHIPLRHHAFIEDKLFDWEMYQRFDRKTKKGLGTKMLLKLIDLVCRR
jgi:hypothetical protein